MTRKKFRELATELIEINTGKRINKRKLVSALKSTNHFIRRKEGGKSNWRAKYLSDAIIRY